MRSPRDLTPFIGRTSELAELEDVLSLRGAKLIVIKGRYGIGKSRLAAELGARHPEMATYHLTGLPPRQVPLPQDALDEFATTAVQITVALA